MKRSDVQVGKSYAFSLFTSGDYAREAVVLPAEQWKPRRVAVHLDVRDQQINPHYLRSTWEYARGRQESERLDLAAAAHLREVLRDRLGITCYTSSTSAGISFIMPDRAAAERLAAVLSGGER